MSSFRIEIITREVFLRKNIVAVSFCKTVLSFLINEINQA